MKRHLKKYARLAISAAVNHAPWGARNAMLEALFRCYGNTEIAKLILPRLGVVELGVRGEWGMFRNVASDNMLLMVYGETGTWESKIVTEIVNFFGDAPGTYIDVGANIGLTTIPVAKNAGVNCIAFEPEPTNLHYLRQNILENAPNNNVELHAAAVFDRYDTLKLAISEVNLGDHRLTTVGIDGRRVLEVPAVPLDSVADRIKGRLAIKIDTQGAEPFVVQGGRKVLDSAGLLVMEFCPYLMRQMGGNPELVIELIGEFQEVALLESGSDVRQSFMSGAAAQDCLRHKLATARARDSDYFDIIAKR